MENNEKENDLNVDKSDELIEDREQQKKFVHPYRKYQIYIFISFILSIIFISILYRQNKKLEEYLKQKDIAFTTLQNVDNQSKGISQLLDIVNVNYKLINNLDKKRNIDIIRKPNEIYFLSSLINDKAEITYEFCYKSSVDGYDPKTYFKNCYYKSPLVFLIETNKGYRFGAFISVFTGYSYNSEYYVFDEKAFIFSFDTYKKYKVIDPYYAFKYRTNEFPWFGKKDIYIGEDFTETSSSFSEFPSNFKRDESDKGDYILNGGIKKFKIKELEVLIVTIRPD